MKIYLFLAILTLPVAAGAETPPPDPKAIATADEVMKTLGGEQRWNDLRGLRWSFGFEVNDSVKSLRRHSWDKATGWHRVEGKNRGGQAFCYIENVNDSTQGMAWVNGTAIEGDSLRKLMKIAKRLWTNDTYWLLMPYKLRDPGVILKYEGEAKDSTGDYDKLALSFDNVGQTPGDHYWVYVNHENHRIEKWEYVLESQKPPPDGSTWEAWQEHDGLWFATAHRKENGNLFTRDIETVSHFRPTEFTAP